MKSLLEITRDGEAPHSIYLYYSREAVARTQTLDEHCEVAVDFDASNEVVGIEIVDPSDETIALATRFALDHTLSLVGVFDPRAIGT